MIQIETFFSTFWLLNVTFIVLKAHLEPHTSFKFNWIHLFTFQRIETVKFAAYYNTVDIVEATFLSFLATIGLNNADRYFIWLLSTPWLMKTTIYWTISFLHILEISQWYDVDHIFQLMFVTYYLLLFILLNVYYKIFGMCKNNFSAMF